MRSYVHAGGADIPYLLGGDLNAEARANALARFVTMGSFDQIDRYRALNADLQSGAQLLEQRKAEQTSAVDQLTAKREAATKELARLQALLRKRQEEEAARRARAAAAASAAGRRTSASSRSGAAPLIMGGSWLCPVAGAHAFGNDYGDSRSGGRRHAGNDILASRGTPIVAPVAGTVSFRSVSLGGRSFFLEGVDGNEYFGTHLSGYAGGSRSVSAGEVIGYVGDDGNARRHAPLALRDPPRPARHGQSLSDVERPLLTSALGRQRARSAAGCRSELAHSGTVSNAVLSAGSS